MDGFELGRPTRVLVADDDDTTRALFRASLEKAGYQVFEAADGEQAVSALTRDCPDIVLMDAMMPRLDGFGACRQIRAMGDMGQIPILMVTGLDDAESIDAAYDAGATDFVSKPIKWANLRHRIRYMVRQKIMADRLRESEARLANAHRIAHLGSWEWRVDSDVVNWSAEVYHLFGIRPIDFNGTFGGFIGSIIDEDAERVERELKQVVNRGGTLSIDYRIHHPETGDRVIHQEVEVTRTDNDQVWLVGTVQDVSEQRHAQRQIEYLDQHDALTGLPNRKQFKQILSTTLNRIDPARQQVAVVFVGLDRFKRINDTFGHETGDAILRETAARMRGCMQRWARQKGWDSPVISRFGGDEFTLLLSPLSQPDDAARAAGLVLEQMTEPFLVGDQEVYITTSIGIAMHPTDGQSVDTLLQNADAALQHAKTAGKDTYQFYTESMNGDALRRLSLESKLQRALSGDQLELHYQPKVDMHRGNVVGMEALVRWHHPELGMVSPAEFIPIAEESGLIAPIGEWVLREACFQNKRWQDEGLMPVMVSVNLSARQFWQNDLAERVAQALVDSGLDPRYLELEITEGTFMQNADKTIRTLTELKKLGIKLSVDDFGTGYSSLAYLQKFPVDTLKVDRSFVTDVTTNADSAAITRTIVNMAHSLGLSVIAEGVELPDQFAFLLELGCNQLQGYLFSAPLTAEKFAALLAERRRLDVAAMIESARQQDDPIIHPG